MTIHSTDPFAVPDGERSPVRRLRGRLASAVTLWTAIDSGGGPVGLTVSSTLVAEGEPPRLLGLVDEESALFQTVARAGRFVVMPLREEDRQLADKFAGLLPAPGGAFNGYSWLSTPYGPVLDGVGGWAGCRLDASRPLGWMRLLEATIERVEINPGGDRPLVHHRGRYRSLTG